MVPRTILRQLARLRRRERLLRLTWGGARWLALAAAVLTVACLTDWLVDRRQETPWTLRYSLLGVQAALWSLTGILWIFRPLLGRLSDGTLALWVEDRVHRLGHRLISAVQLNRSGAPTQGMSPELIAAVTREAEEQTANIHFTQVADHRRWKWSLALFLPVALVAAGLWLAFPATVEALVARQFLADRPIPRSVLVESVNSEMVVPSGDVADLRFHVTGDAISRDWQGEVRITRAGRPEERVPLEYESRDWPWEATFVAHVPPTDDADFTYQASVRDGRTRDSSRVHYEPRPAVVEQRAWVVLPRYVGLRPDGTPYEQEQPRGDILGLREASARVAVTIQKPVSRAVLEFLSPSEAQPGTKPEPEKVLRRMDLALREDGRRAEGTFALADLGAGEAAYRVVVEDQYGFRNLDPARRGIRIAAEETPHVALLPEQFPGRDDRGTGEDSEVEGLPVPLGGSIRLGYTCSAPYGLGRARLRYRVNDGSWWHLPLAEVQAGDKTGPFDSARGVFANSGPMDQVEFHTIPSPDPTRFVGGTEGGGRFDFQTRKIPGLKVGDKIELCVEVFDRNPDPTRPPGRSEERVKSIVTVPELETWVRNTLQEESRIRRLEARQRGVFGQAGDEDSVATAQGETTPDNTGAPRPVREGPATSFVRDWQLLGVFPSFGGQGHQTVYPPETEPVNLAGEYPLIKNSIRWQPYQSLGDYIDLAKYFKHRTAGVAYAVCWVHSEGDRPIQVRTGSDDGLKVWLRRNLVTDVQTNRAAAPGQETAGAHLQPGWNELLVKVDNGDSEWGFYLEILDPATGKMPEDLDFRTTLPEKDIAVQGQPSPAFLRDWQLVGPFPNPDDRGLETAYPPELENVDLTREFDGLPGKVRWRLHHSDDGKIDLEKFFAHDDAGVAYALCWVRSPWKRPALLATGSDDGLKVWVNRKVVLTERVHREAVPGDDKTPIELEAGWNELLVKVDNRVGTWAFYLELREPGTGAALPGIEVRTTPPGAEAPRIVQKNRKFLRNWQVIGPFPNPDGHGRSDHPPERGRVELDEEFQGLKGMVRWQAHRSPADYIDLARLYDCRVSAVAYAVCWVRSDRAQPAVLSLGSNDGIKVWLNRKEVFTHDIGRSAAPDQDTARADLAAGWNELLVKSDNHANDWGFYLELREPDNQRPLEGITVQLRPPEDNPRKYLRDWQLAGPFPNPNDQGRNTVYSPESEPFRADREFDGIGGKFRWRAFHTDKGYVNLERFYARPFGESNVAYAVCWVHAGRARPAVLATGSDDGLKVWIDRKLVLDRAVHREAVPGEDTQRIDLPAEWAEVLVKVDNQFGRWGFYLELRDPDTGRPLEGVQVRPTPPPGVQPRPGPGGHVFLRSWQVIGPFPNPDHHGRSVYPPEQEKFDPAREYNGLKGKVRWKQDDSPTDYIDLAHPCNTVEPALAYAVCWVRSDRARPVVLSLGSNDGIKVWLNRKEVFTHDIWRSANPGQDTTRADLQAGWNELLVKDDNQGGPWGFYLELRDPDTNRPLAGAEIRATPPGEALKPGQAGHAFVRDWQVVGPFPNPNRTAHATPLPPETQPYNPSHEYQGIKGRVRWQLLQSSTDYIDLAHWFAHRQAAVAYARCWVHADRKRPALLSIGSNDGIKIWINHQQVFAHEIGRSARPGQDGARSELEAGWNEVLVKVDNFDNDWGFYLEFQDPGTNRPLEGIDFRSTPPAAGNK